MKLSKKIIPLSALAIASLFAVNSQISALTIESKSIPDATVIIGGKTGGYEYYTMLASMKDVTPGDILVGTLAAKTASVADNDNRVVYKSGDYYDIADGMSKRTKIVETDPIYTSLAVEKTISYDGTVTTLVTDTAFNTAKTSLANTTIKIPYMKREESLKKAYIKSYIEKAYPAIAVSDIDISAKTVKISKGIETATVSFTAFTEETVGELTLTDPIKTDYLVGESLDLTGLKLKGLEEITITMANIFGFNSEVTATTQRISVKIGTVVVETFDVNILENNALNQAKVAKNAAIYNMIKNINEEDYVDFSNVTSEINTALGDVTSATTVAGVNDVSTAAITTEINALVKKTKADDDRIKALLAGTTGNLNALLYTTHADKEAAEIAIKAEATHGTLANATVVWDGLKATITLNDGTKKDFTFNEITSITTQLNKDTDDALVKAKLNNSTFLNDTYATTALAETAIKNLQIVSAGGHNTLSLATIVWDTTKLKATVTLNDESKITFNFTNITASLKALDDDLIKAKENNEAFLNYNYATITAAETAILALATNGTYVSSQIVFAENVATITPHTGAAFTFTLTFTSIQSFKTTDDDLVKAKQNDSTFLNTYYADKETAETAIKDLQAISATATPKGHNTLKDAKITWNGLTATITLNSGTASFTFTNLKSVSDELNDALITTGRNNPTILNARYDDYEEAKDAIQELATNTYTSTHDYTTTMSTNGMSITVTLTNGNLVVYKFTNIGEGKEAADDALVEAKVGDDDFLDANYDTVNAAIAAIRALATNGTYSDNNITNINNVVTVYKNDTQAGTNYFTFTFTNITELTTAQITTLKGDTAAGIIAYSKDYGKDTIADVVAAIKTDILDKITLTDYNNELIIKSINVTVSNLTSTTATALVTFIDDTTKTITITDVSSFELTATQISDAITALNSGLQNITKDYLITTNTTDAEDAIKQDIIDQILAIDSTYNNVLIVKSISVTVSNLSATSATARVTFGDDTTKDITITDSNNFNASA